MFDLKPLSRDAIPAALAKAERYRLLNEPGEAESICLDVLQIEPANQDALVMLILALTDQFPRRCLVAQRRRARQRAGRPARRRVRPRVLRRASSASGAPRRCCSATATLDGRRRRVAARGDGASSNAPKRSGRRIMTTRCCAGMRVRALLEHLPDTQPDVREEPIQLE